MTILEASLEKKENIVYSNLRDDRKIQKPKFSLGDLVRTADIKRVFSKGDSTNWNYVLYTITEKIHDTIASYRRNHLPERYKEKLFTPTSSTLDCNNQVMKKLILIQYYEKY